MSDSGITTKVVNEKREQFEAQLRSLQNDIGLLSQKLAIPLTTLPSGGDFAMNDGITLSSRSEDNVYGAGQSNTYGGKGVKKNVTFENQQLVLKQQGNGGSSLLSQKKAEVIRLVKELRGVTRERDDLQYRFEQLKRETEEMKKTLSDVGKLRSICENLQQDNASLKMSLESSEKIRKQQKELIIMMQRSTQHSIESASLASSVKQMPSSQLLNTSLSSFGAGSSVADTSVGSIPHNFNVSFKPAPSAVSNEQRDWLTGHSIGNPASRMENYKPAMHLASPVMALPKQKVVPDSSTDLAEQHVRDRVTGGKTGKRTTSISSSKNSKGRKSSKSSTEIKFVGSGSHISGSGKKAVNSRSGGTKRPSRGKKVVKVPNKEAKQGTKSLKACDSVATQSTSGVYSFDEVLASGVLAVPSPYHSAHQQSQNSSGKPPRVPKRRSSSASAIPRSSHPATPVQSSSTHSASKSNKIQPRGRSLTPEPMHVSNRQFHFSRSPLTLTQHPQYHTGTKRNTLMRTRLAQK